jgi:very-short-patch-repair endonuclease
MNSKTRSPKYVIELAREMRVNLTIPEKILWEKLKTKKIDGHRFRIQHPIYRYILDFYCHEKKLAIEIDGDVHKFRKDYDEYRDEYLKSAGISTIRFKNEDVTNNIDYVLSEIRNYLAQLISS